MKIALIVEGSYPYVSGGVSSWIQTLIREMPNHEFEIVAISAEKKSANDYKYTVPENVSGITNIVLKTGHESQKNDVGFLDEEKMVIKKWLSLEEPNIDALRILGKETFSISSFFSSRFFWDMVREHYEKEDENSSFLEYFWMWRSMYEPVMHLLGADYPKVDIVHAVSTGYAGLVASYMKATQNIPYILTEHGIYSREREEEILRSEWIPASYKDRWIRFFHHLSVQAYREADDIVTLFERNATHQVTIGAKKEKVKIIPNGINFNKLANYRSKIEQLGHFHIGAIVRVVPIKDIKTMIYAAKILQQRGRDFVLTIMGPLDEDEEYASECLSLIEQNGLEDIVRLVGKVAIEDYLPQFDICILTSISEGQPLAVLEGMAAGIPWVVSDVGACSELVYGGEGDPHGPAGFVVPPVNPEMVANYCEWYMDHPEQRKQFGENGKKRVEEYYQTQQFIYQYEQLYEKRGIEYGRNRV